MKVFISWSGERSQQLATALHDWLPLVINSIQPWLSSEDISAGSRWNAEVAKSLDESRVGIFCLTQENLDSPWLHFEAGAIAKDSTRSFACTLLLDVTPTQVKWPLAQFQAKGSDKKSIFELIQTINNAAPNPLLRPEHLLRSFEKWWPELEEKINLIPPAANGQTTRPQRTPDDLLEEILGILRRREREVHPVVNSQNSLWPNPDAAATFELEKTRGERAAKRVSKIIRSFPDMRLREMTYGPGNIEVVWGDSNDRRGKASFALPDDDAVELFPDMLESSLRAWTAEPSRRANTKISFRSGKNSPSA